jgi:calcineurin-like phosphoesterase family protein
MDKKIISNWNRVVRPADTVFVLGDVFFKKSGQSPDSGWNFEKVKAALNGEKVFIQGNHDRHQKCKIILKTAVIEYGGHIMHLSHKPEHANPNYKINLVGHVHEKWKTQKMLPRGYGGLWTDSIMINVGVDQWRFFPVSIDQILKAHKEHRDAV